MVDLKLISALCCFLVHAQGAPFFNWDNVKTQLKNLEEKVSPAVNRGCDIFKYISPPKTVPNFLEQQPFSRRFNPQQRSPINRGIMLMKFPQASRFPQAPWSRRTHWYPQAAGFPQASRFPQAPWSRKTHWYSQAARFPQASRFPQAPWSIRTHWYPQAPRFPQAPSYPQAPESPKAPESAEAPESPKAPESPEAPESPKAPESPQTPEPPQATASPVLPQDPSDRSREEVEEAGDKEIDRPLPEVPPFIPPTNDVDETSIQDGDESFDLEPIEPNPDAIEDDENEEDDDFDEDADVALQ